MHEKLDLDQTVNSLVDLAIEAWRFQKLFGKALNKLDPTDAARFVNQHRFFLRKIDQNLETAGLRLVNLEGQPYEDGPPPLPLISLSLETATQSSSIK
jgi:hypothetical protein